MANRINTVTVSAADRAVLERRVRSQMGPARDAWRARIVLLAADGWPAAEIAELVVLSPPSTSWPASSRSGRICPTYRPSCVYRRC